MIDYQEFLKNKVAVAKMDGINISPEEVNPILKPHQRDAVVWAVRGGRRALFESFGMGKTLQMLEIVRLILKHEGGKGLIVMPLGVKQEFEHDASMIGLPVKFIRRIEETGDDGVYLTNYETIRDGKLDPRSFVVVGADEAGVLRGMGSTLTFRQFMAVLAGDDRSGIRTGGVKYRFVATATPSPNDYIELLAYADYLGIMQISEAKTRFFKRDSTKADHLTIHPHKDQEFWLWVATWALFIQKPSDLGYSDEGYILPPLDIRWHEVKIDISKDTRTESNGQIRLFRDAAIGVQDSAKEKRISLDERIKKVMELREEDPGQHRIIWHDLEAERNALEKHISGITTVYGSQDLEDRVQAIIDFSNGKIQELAAKPVMLGAGTNLQKHCHWAIFLGIGFKFYSFVQAIHRVQRFLQEHPVRIDLIYTSAEYRIRKQLERKWNQHNEMVRKMAEIIKEYGLTEAAISKAMQRSMGVERIEVNGKNYRLINNDCVLETREMGDNSVDLILTSPPFSTQYEYSPCYNDMGHTNSNEHFFEQMDYLTPHLLRVLRPGRIAAIHVKDRIVPGGLTGLGFQVVYPFHCKTIEHFTKHGFAYMGMKTIVTDVVRENNQTYRLGWTEQCKDGTKMGVGMPEYLLLFRKPPTDNSNSYADVPVVKTKQKYSRSKWQIDAHGFARSDGNRFLTSEELESLPHEAIFKLFREYNLTHVYDFEQHVKIGEELDAKGRLPVTFMLLQPPSWHPDVWTDIARMLTLNNAQSAKGREMHLCPMAFNLTDRVIEQFSMEGETVFDPFSGVGTVPYRAVLKKRYGIGVELAYRYFLDGAYYCKAAENEVSMPTLFSINEDKNE